MTTGFGMMQREIIRALHQRTELGRPEFWHDLEGLRIVAEEPTMSEHATFKRAARSLGQRGLVEQSIRKTGAHAGHHYKVIVRFPFLPADHRDAVGMGLRATAIDDEQSHGRLPPQADRDWLTWYRDVPAHAYVGTEFYAWPDAFA